VAIKASGISAVIASSFARIFFRNGINIGLPLLESQEASLEIENGDTIEIDLEQGIIKDVTTNRIYKAKPYPDFMMDIVNAGGLVEHTRKKITGGL
jgi:3-isopropylmalate/(R)-2-methylmalate dehydratase small subunit